MENKTLEEINLKELCLDKMTLGQFTFDAAFPILEKMREDFITLKTLDYENQLTGGEVGEIESTFNSFLTFINNIRDFKTSNNYTQDRRDTIENEIKIFYSQEFRRIFPALIRLRQNLQLENKTEKELEESLIKSKKYEAEIEKIKKEFSEALEKIKQEKEDVEEGKGIVSSKYMSKEFETQALEHSKAATEYYRLFKKMYKLLLVLVPTLFLVYLILFKWLKFTENDGSTKVEFLATSIIIISIVFYLFTFYSRNYNIQKNLEMSNKHRRNVAETFQHFLNSGINDEDSKNTFLKTASVAMFENLTSGYLSKDQMQISTPTQEMITKIISNKI